MKLQITLKLQSISLVESTGIEPVTSCLQGRRSPSWANPPNRRSLIVSSLLPIESPAKRVSIGEEKPICKGAFRFQRNAEFAKRASTKWWAKMDSLFCGKATPVATVHRTVAKSRLSSPVKISLVQPFSFPLAPVLNWWAKMDSNHRPHDYQSCALASWAIGPYQLHFLFRYIFPCTL